jgi:type IV pilus assembly protein PilW
MTAAPGRGKARGVSLIQLLVGMATGVSVVAALAAFFIQGSRSGREDINVASMLNELGFAAGQLAVDLEMAGFLAQVHDPSAIERDGSLALGGSDCGGAGWFSDLRALQVLDNNTGTSGPRPASVFPCLVAADVVPGTDIVAVKRVLGRLAGTDTSTAGLRAGTIYLRTHGRGGLLYLRGAGTPPPMETPWQEWEYAPAVYYVRRYTASPAEQPPLPSLCRRTLRSAGGAAPAFEAECVAEGVENLQVEIGVDDDEDGAANYFTATPTAGEMARASNARVYVLVRSARPDVNYLNRKTYQIGNSEPFTPAGDQVHYFRKTLATEVALRNPRGLHGVAVQ